jgi:hypothetical protein
MDQETKPSVQGGAATATDEITKVSSSAGRDEPLTSRKTSTSDDKNAAIATETSASLTSDQKTYPMVQTDEITPTDDPYSLRQRKHNHEGKVSGQKTRAGKQRKIKK